MAYPIAVYVFEGDECKASQTIGDEGDIIGVCLGRCVGIRLCAAYGVGRFDYIGDYTVRGKGTD